MLTVLSVAYPLAPVHSDAVGGAEQVLAAIDRALIRAGHRSLVLAQEGSHVEGQLRSLPVEAGPFTPALRARIARHCRERTRELLDRESVDIVHFHGCDCADYIEAAEPYREVPKLVTVHLPADWYDARLFEPGRGFHFNCVSEWQRAQLSERITPLEAIDNGVDLERWFPEPGPSGGYVACLGRICPEKGFDLALRAARAAGLPLLLAGHVFGYPEHERYFETCIVPLLDVERRFLGPLRGAAKREFLRRALCLVVPSRVAETSSLVTMEALSCGTPVIVTGLGAPASLIEPGVTGWVATQEDELRSALGRVGELDRSACRASAERRFDLRETTRKYLELYYRLRRP